jgi:hypothetical protein
LLDLFGCLLQQCDEAKKIDVEMNPVITHAHYHIVNDEIHVADDVVGSLCRKVVRLIRLQLLQHKFSQQQFVKLVETGQVDHDGLARRCQDYRVADHVDDILAELQTA